MIPELFEDIVFSILLFQEGKDLDVASRVCRLWNCIAKSKQLWNCIIKTIKDYLPQVKDNYFISMCVESRWKRLFYDERIYTHVDEEPITLTEYVSLYIRILIWIDVRKTIGKDRDMASIHLLLDHITNRNIRNENDTKSSTNAEQINVQKRAKQSETAEKNEA